MAREKVQFTATDGQQLSGIIDRPDGDTRAYALFAHCFTCSKNLRAVGNIAASLNEAGIAVLRFDFTGLGESEGEFADTNFSSNVSDLVAAASFLTAKYQAPAILIGHSLGGTAILQAAAQIPEAVAVVTIGSPSQPSHVAAMLEGDRAQIEKAGQATVQLGGRPFVIKKQFLDDLEQRELSRGIGSLRKALLVMHAPLDDIVEIDNASELSTVRVTHAKIHARECADCESPDGKIDEFQRELTLEGNLSAEQRQRLLEIADKCPVHRSLHNEVKIRTTLVECQHRSVESVPEGGARVCRKMLCERLSVVDRDDLFLRRQRSRGQIGRGPADAGNLDLLALDNRHGADSHPRA
jgi:alpha/beta superfamily hydrolase